MSYGTEKKRLKAVLCSVIVLFSFCMYVPASLLYYMWLIKLLFVYLFMLSCVEQQYWVKQGLTAWILIGSGGAITKMWGT